MYNVSSKMQFLYQEKTGLFKGHWRAVDSETKQKLYIRYFSKTTTSIDVCNTIFKEMQYLKNLNFKFITQPIGLFEDTKFYYSIFPTPEEDSLPLAEYISIKGCLPENWCMSFINQWNDFIEYISSHDIYSYDVITPESIFIINNGNNEVITNLYIAFKNSVIFDNNEVLTQKIIPPEILTFHHPKETSDSWTLGVLLFFCSTGYFPFEGESKEEINKEILFSHPNYPSALSPEFKELIAKMLTKNQLVRKSSLRNSPKLTKTFSGYWQFRDEDSNVKSQILISSSNFSSTLPKKNHSSLDIESSNLMTLRRKYSTNDLKRLQGIKYSKSGAEFPKFQSTEVFNEAVIEKNKLPSSKSANESSTIRSILSNDLIILSENNSFQNSAIYETPRKRKLYHYQNDLDSSNDEFETHEKVSLNTVNNEELLVDQNIIDNTKENPIVENLDPPSGKQIESINDINSTNTNINTNIRVPNTNIIPPMIKSGFSNRKLSKGNGIAANSQGNSPFRPPLSLSMNSDSDLSLNMHNGTNFASGPLTTDSTKRSPFAHNAKNRQRTESYSTVRISSRKYTSNTPTPNYRLFENIK
ncbi:hypothetical protein TRFO_36272 [Tritrichomonas foetus]|uniref:Protein kinase domain-containing protein n=1 Tax=Tritrichomonas foetus TaxID=1144522 RepID=A0A1J4JFS9_9EUKA|nr:hypothetical protein TRFO_36272 [Tritrichomonas foetus]|eukprot:OHS97513.1 hypothetical protein TRFO_36272 [Tritrichomonas foetus]